MFKFSVGVIGNGFVGGAVAAGFSLHADVKIYDKYKKIGTLEEVAEQDFIFSCVPTNTTKNGKQDLSVVEGVLSSLKETITDKHNPIIILKSTLLPGTTRMLSNKYKLKLVFNPEFLTARQARLDFINPARIIIGGVYSEELDAVEELYRFRFKSTPIYKVSWEEAEIIKYMCNVFFHVKISYLNEIYDVCQKLNISYDKMREMFLADGRIGNSHTDVPGHDGDRGVGGTCVLPSAKLLKDDGKFIDIKGLYHKYIRSHVMPKIQSCNHTCDNIDFKEIENVTRRFAFNEDILIFETEYGKFTCSKEHLIPVYRDGKLTVIQAKDITIEDELIISDEKVMCSQGCGREAKSAKCSAMKIKNSVSVKKTTQTDVYRKNNHED